MRRFLAVVLCAGSIYTLWDNEIYWRYIAITLTLVALATWGIVAIYDAQENKDNESKDKVWYASISIIPIMLERVNWHVRNAGFALLVVGLIW